MVLIITSLCPRQYDGADGRLVYEAVKPFLLTRQPVTLSFAGVTTVTTSFVNEALVRLLDTFSYDDIKTYIRIEHVTPPVARVIRDRFAFETRHRTAA